VVELSLGVQHRHPAEAALAAPAIPHQLYPMVAQRVEHRAVLGHRDLAIPLVMHAHYERFRGKTSTRGEGLKAQPIRLASALLPGPLRGVSQAQRSA